MGCVCMGGRTAGKHAAFFLCHSHRAFQTDLAALWAAHLCASSCVLCYLAMPFIQVLPSVTKALRWGDHIINEKSRIDKVVKLNTNQEHQQTLQLNKVGSQK